MEAFFEGVTPLRVHLESMEKVLAMGMEEGLKAALGQMDEVLRHA